jgi:uncharacterized membrane protein YqgA involved in biofilm formation
MSRALVGTRIGLDRFDRHHRVTTSATALALLGLGIAAAMAAFGLPSFDLHGPLHYVGIMDPLCGGTRAARLTAQGDLARAWEYNPLGIVVVIGAVAVLLRSVVGWASGRWLNLHARLTPRQKRALLAILVIAAIVLEIRQQQRVDLLTAQP